jgi:hypothetical protein
MTEILTEFTPISLDEMNGIRLMNRIDTKFVVTLPVLNDLLFMAKPYYRVQEVDGERNIPYYTVYFDTFDFGFFNDHQCGRAFRQKVRIRSYVHSHLNFLEVKTKDNHGRTRKKRVEMKEFDPQHPLLDISFRSSDAEFAKYRDFLCSILMRSPDVLGEQMENRFHRITLVNNSKTERLTIDTDLSFHNLTTGKTRQLDEIAVVELKRDGLFPSPIIELLRQLHVQPLSFSKYCMGLSMTDSRLRSNRFKPRLHRIDSMIASAH